MFPFMNPVNLLWLLLVVPVIIFFYLLKLKRRSVTVSSTFLWSHLIQDVQANAPFQKLRRNLLLFLQLAIAILAVLALARPFWISQAIGGDKVVLILDGSASMQSRDERGSRFDEARRQALRMVDGMASGGVAQVILATSRTERLTSFTSDKGELRRALNDAKPADTTTNLREAIELGAAVSSTGDTPVGQRARMYVLSDGAFADLGEIDTRGAELNFVKVGKQSRNVGIVALDVRKSFTTESDYQTFAAVRNYGDQPVTTNLELYRNEVLMDVRKLQIPAARADRGYAEATEVFDNMGSITGIVRARLDTQDDLTVDNEAWSQLSPRRDVAVLLVTQENLFLEQALNLDPKVKVSRVAPSGYARQAGFDVVVFDGFAPAEVGPGNYLYINAGGPTAPVDIAGTVEHASITDWDRTHPMMRFVDLGQVNLFGLARAAKKKPWAQELAGHEEGPVMVAGERRNVLVDGQRMNFKSAYVGFNFKESNLPLKPAFPIFIGNAVQWLAAQPGRTEGIQLRTGETVSLDVPGNTKELTVTTPAGETQRLPVEGPVVNYDGTDRVGVYTVEAGKFKREFAVNLLSRDESATKPQEKIQLGRRPVSSNATQTVRSNREFWRLLVVLALLVLAFEWYAYHRRL